MRNSNYPKPGISNVVGLVTIVMLFTATHIGGCKKNDAPVSTDPSRSANSERPSKEDSQKRYSEWSAPVNLGSVINGSSSDQHPFISKDGLTLFISSNRTGTLGDLDIWVSERESPDAPWGPPQNLGININSGGVDMAPFLSPDEHWLYFHSGRAGGSGAPDLYVARRQDRHNNFNWEPAVNLGPLINGPCDDAGPTYYENESTGETVLYFTTRRPVSGTGPCGEFDIWQSIRQPDGSWGAPTYVPELSSVARDTRTAIRRRDGLEMIVSSGRAGGQGNQDLWVTTRTSTLDSWGPFVNLGPVVNTSFFDGAPALSFDAKTLFFFSDRPGGFGGNDLYVSTRTHIH